MSSTDIKEKIIAYLREELDPEAIVLFGSFVTGSFREASDVDIAFLSDKDVSAYDLFLIAQGLAAAQILKSIAQRGRVYN